MYKVTDKCLDLVSNLLDEGYAGDARFVKTSSTYTGVHDSLGDCVVVSLTGFCKEDLHIVEDMNTGEVLFVGRYSIDERHTSPCVADIVAFAADAYRYYKQSGYSMPVQFEDLFKKYGYLTVETVTTTKKTFK